MARHKKRTTRPEPGRPKRTAHTAGIHLRIVGGRFRGRKLAYSGDPRTRPMKNRVREAAFNLIGPSVVGKHAIDLFAGTGAMGFEAISRGAVQATLIERHLPTLRVMQQNAKKLAIDPVTEFVSADALLWTQAELYPGTTPWLLFCCPPYELYQTRTDQILQMLEVLIQRASAASVLYYGARTCGRPTATRSPIHWARRGSRFWRS